MVLPFSSPPSCVSRNAGPEETKNLAGESPPPDSDPFSDGELCENLACLSRSKPQLGMVLSGLQRGYAKILCLTGSLAFALQRGAMKRLPFILFAMCLLSPLAHGGSEICSSKEMKQIAPAPCPHWYAAN